MTSYRTLDQSRKSWYQALIDKTGSPRFDVSPIWADPIAFSALINDIILHFKDIKYDKIIAFDALGFILGGALANRANKGLIPLRKGGKLPLPNDRIESVQFEDYDGTTKTFEFVSNLISKDDRVLLVDEWMGTGAQMAAAIELMESLGIVVAGVAVLYLFPDFPRNLEIVGKYETFTSNCLKCMYFKCRCEEDQLAELK